MMRKKVFSLRNPSKIKEAKGEEFYYNLIHSLRVYRVNNEMQPFLDHETGKEMIVVQNHTNKKQVFQFALVEGGLYDVQRVAYFKTIENE